MSYPFPPDLQSLVSQQMATGRFRSEDDLLREALERMALDEGDDLAAIQEAIDEWKAGDPGQPLAEAFAEIRASARKPQ